MKALVLSAGYGTRLAPFTDLIPKAMFPVLGSSFISIVTSNLKSVGISDFGVNLYHLGDKLGAHLLRMKDSNTNFQTIREEELMGTGGAIAQFRDFLYQDEFIIHNCDIISDAQLQTMIDFHKKKSPLATLLLVDFPKINSLTVSKDGQIIDICNTLGFQGEHEKRTFGGIAILSPEIFQHFPGVKPFSIIDIYLKLIKEAPGSVIGWQPEKKFYWRDVGSISSYVDLHKDILVNRTYRSDNLEIPDNSIYKGFDVFIHSGAKVDGFAVFGDYVRIPKAAVIKDSIIWAGTELPKGFRAVNKVVFKNIMVSV